MDDVKNCSKCKNILLKTDFHKIKILVMDYNLNVNPVQKNIM